MIRRMNGLLASFGYAFQGLIYCIRSERHMRIHLAAGGYVLFLSRFFQFSAAENVVLILTIGLVISLEMVNTAIESIIDLLSPAYNELARIAKDVVAGAVLISALISLGTAAFLFSDREGWVRVMDALFGSPIPFAVFLASVLLALGFIFYPFRIDKKTHLPPWKQP